jgi:uncharacterized LabA/DUF88 family protein
MKIGVFVDTSNLYYCINKQYDGRKLDYKKYLEAVLINNTLYRAFAYGAQVADHALNFITYLRALGFETKYKEIRYKKQTEAEERREIERINWGVGITIDVIRLLDKVDVVIIGSADRDLVPLVEYIKSKGVKCNIVACNIPKDLRLSCDFYIEVDESLLEEKEEKC